MLLPQRCRAARTALLTALVAAALLLACGRTAVVAATGSRDHMTAERWNRPLAGMASLSAAPVLLPLPDGSVLVRDGEGVVALDSQGRRRWSMPNVIDAIVHGGTVVFRRPATVFAIRSGDGTVLWTRACARAPYLAAARDRIVTLCDGASTVLRARDGMVLAQHGVIPVADPRQFWGARPLNDDYVLVANVFDGAWMGTRYIVVDAHTGAFGWNTTDIDVLDVTPTTIAIAQYPSMLPWSRAGHVERRRIADGVVVASADYQAPVDADTAVRGRVVMTPAAVYVAPANDSGVFRFRRGLTHGGQRLSGMRPVEIAALGGAAFILADGALYLDRPSGRGRFVTRRIGRYSAALLTRRPLSSFTEPHGGVRIGGRFAAADGGFVRLYDELGRVELTARSPCRDPQLAATTELLYMLCEREKAPAQLVAFPRPLTVQRTARLEHR